MNRAVKVHSFATPRSDLNLYAPSVSETSSARWRINGHPAIVIVWTVDEWERLKERPIDAQYYPCGIWCALRME